MKELLFGLPLAAAATLLTLQAAHGQQAPSGPKCLPREQALELLMVRHGEERQSMGLARGGVMEMFASEGGSWSVVITTPQGLTCLIAAGQSFAGQPAAIVLGEGV